MLRDGGRALVFQTFGTDRLEPREAEWLWRALGVEAGSTDPPRNEAAIAAAGLLVLYAARLLRDPERYRAQFGEAAYEIMLGDCFWHVYAMIGKLERRVYLLTKH